MQLWNLLNPVENTYLGNYYQFRGGGTGEAGEATASPEFRGFTAEKFLASWMYERGNFSCFTGKKIVPPPLNTFRRRLVQ